MPTEIWKDIPDWEGYYQASILGDIRSVDRMTASRGAKMRVLKQSLQNSGYLIVGLHKNNRNRVSLVHRLVAFAFIPNPECKKYINHKDGIRLITGLKISNGAHPLRI
jgi:hypothetical protein